MQNGEMHFEVATQVQRICAKVVKLQTALAFGMFHNDLI